MTPSFYFRRRYAFAIAVVTLIAVFISLRRGPTSSAAIARRVAHSDQGHVLSSRSLPARFEIVVPADLRIVPEVAVSTALQKLRAHPLERLSPSLRLHAIQAEGLKVRSTEAFVASDNEVLAAFLNSRTEPGGASKPAFSPSQFGIAPSEDFWSTGLSGSHTDQILAILAHLGIPLSTTIRLEAGEYSVADLLNESRAQFRIDQREIEWSAISYALY